MNGSFFDGLKFLESIAARPEAVSVWVGRVRAAYEGCDDWSEEHQRRVGERIAILTVQRIVGDLHGLPREVREQCRAAKTMLEATNATAAADATRALLGGGYGCHAVTSTAVEMMRKEGGLSDLGTAHHAAVCANHAAWDAAARTSSIGHWPAAEWGYEASSNAELEANERVLAIACGIWLEARKEVP